MSGVPLDENMGVKLVLLLSKNRFLVENLFQNKSTSRPLSYYRLDPFISLRFIATYLFILSIHHAPIVDVVCSTTFNILLETIKLIAPSSR